MTLIHSDPDIRSLLKSARTIAVVGLSANPARDSFRVADYMRLQGYAIIPVNPSITSVMDLSAYPTLESVPGHIDIVNIFRRPEFVPPIVDAAIRLHAGAVWMQLGVGHEGAARKAATAGLTVVMERCIMVEHRRLAI
jgi:predicted CoA-binding protein